MTATPPSLGIIGVGELGYALALAILKNQMAAQVYLSPRSEHRVSKLSTDDGVVCCTTNAEVVTRADMLCLCVRPDQLAEVAQGLPVSPGQVVISFVAGASLSQLKNLFSQANLYRALALPFIQDGYGPLTTYPNNKAFRRLFSKSSTWLDIQSESQLDDLFSVGGLMSSFVALTRLTEKHLCTKGLPEQAARDSINSLLMGLAWREANDPDRSDGFAKYETPKGLNQKCRNYLNDERWFEQFSSALSLLDNKHKG